MIILAYISEEEFNSRLEKIKEKNMSNERRKKLKEEKKKYRPKIKLPSTSKLVLLVVFLLCIEIVIFSEYAMVELGDASAMYVLIGIPTTLVPTIIAYYQKSRAENTSGGIVFENAMRSDQYDEYEQDFSNDEALG